MANSLPPNSAHDAADSRAAADPAIASDPTDTALAAISDVTPENDDLPCEDSPRRPSPLDVISHGRTPRPTPPNPARYRMPRSDEYSAGGLVVSQRGATPAAAIIGRTDRRGRLLWSLPKGHIEAGETAVQAAIREVEEETGIIGTVVAPLGKIDYWFVAEGRRVHKTVTHFLMNAIGGELSDEDAEVVAVEWVPLDKLSRRLAYADERRIAIDAIRILAETA